MRELAARLVLLGILCPAIAVGESQAASKVDRAVEVVDEIMAVPDRSIPEYLFRDAAAIAVIPDVLKAGLFVGGRRGKGIMSLRCADGSWGPPLFISLSGGSVGWQVGVQRVDIVLVFKSGRSVDAVLEGRFTLGADAAIAVGPVGRHAEATTDIELQAEIYSYARARGFFAGLALEGSVLQVDQDLNADLYGIDGLSAQDVVEGRLGPIPPQAVLFRRALERHFAAAD